MQPELRGRHRPGSLFIRWWIIHLAGWTAVLLLFMLWEQIPISSLPLRDNFILVALLLGAVWGLVYWRGLRSRFNISVLRWMSGTAVGFFAGGTALIWAQLRDLYILTTPPGSGVLEWDPLLGGALFGLALGLGLSWAWRLPSLLMLKWTVAHVVGWSAALFFSHLTLYLLRGAPPMAHLWNLLELLLQGGISGGVTGLGLLLIATDIP